MAKVLAVDGTGSGAGATIALAFHLTFATGLVRVQVASVAESKSPEPQATCREKQISVRMTCSSPSVADQSASLRLRRAGLQREPG